MPFRPPPSPLETGYPNDKGRSTLLTAAQNHALDQWVTQLPQHLGTVLLTHDQADGSEPICRELIRRLPETHHVAWVLQPRLSLLDFMRTVCHAFRIHGTPKEDDALEAWDRKLVALVQASRQSGKTVVLVINDAHLAPFFALNHLCRLNTSAPDGQALMHVVLLGHKSLLKQLEQAELAPTHNTVVARHPLDEHYTDSVPQPPTAQVAEALPPLDDDWLTGPDPRQADAPQPPPAQALRPPADATFALNHPVERPGADRAVPARPQRPSVSPGWSARTWPATGAWKWAAAPAVALVGLLIWWLWPQASEPLLLTQSTSTSTTAQPEQQPLVAPAVAGPREHVGGIIDASAADIPTVVTAPTGIDTPEASLPEPVNAVPRLAELVDDQYMTWPHLGRLWGITLSGESACEQALAQGVQCFRSNGLDLDQVRAMDRPAMLLLHQEGTDKWVRLLGLDEKHARLASSGREWTLPLNELEALWKSGALATLWRLPPGQTRRVFNAGPQDPAGRWLDEQLRALQSQGQLKPSADTYLARVTTFQQVNDLRSDGRATPTTFVLVNRLRRTDEPRLLDAFAR